MINKRGSGVLLHISSLPGKFGIGTLGEEAYSFVDFLKKSGQTYWQILPIGPTGFGDSPYQSFSSFAGNPYFIDFDLIEKDGYLKKQDYENINWGGSADRVDYSEIFNKRYDVFKKMYESFKNNVPSDFFKFQANNPWLSKYAEFMEEKYFFDCKKPLYEMLQYFFYKQWNDLRKYANKQGIKIIGDIPIYVATDSSDILTEPKQFLLDDNMKPKKVAGCPPDDFTPDGQLWGNPIYDWDYMKRTGYSWWINRIKHCAELFDVIRIDHFRGFDSYYCIEPNAKNARKGEWFKGPGMDFFDKLNKNCDVSIIAEDLGFITNDVRELLKKCGYPGMKVLQFAFDTDGKNEYLPYNYDKNCVAYIGTHDNDTFMGWLKKAPKKAFEYLKLNESEEKNWCAVDTVMSSVANTVIITMQDLLGKDSTARMNTPSTAGNNWQWRVNKGEITDKLAEKLLTRTKLYGRLGG